MEAGSPARWSLCPFGFSGEGYGPWGRAHKLQETPCVRTHKRARGPDLAHPPRREQFLSQGCRGKLPHTGLGQQARISKGHSSGGKKFKIQVSQDWFLLEALREHLFQATLLVVAGNPWRPLPCGCITTISTSTSTWRSSLCLLCLCPNYPLLIRTPVTGPGRS